MIKKAKKITTKIVRAPKSFISWVVGIKDVIALMRKGLKDLPGTNIELAQYHLENGNVSDAIFRLKIIEKFFSQNNPAVHNLLGWCYFVKGDHYTAQEHLQKASKEDKAHLGEFLQNIDKIDIIPDVIYSQFRNIKAEEIVNALSSTKVNLVREFVDLLNPHLTAIPDEYKILELGSNIGMLGSEMRKLLPDIFTLAAIEPSKEMIMLEEAYFGEEENYNELDCDNVMHFLKASKKEAEIIVSLNGLGFTSKLDDVLAAIKLRLKKDGHFAFLSRVDDQSYLDKNTLEFVMNSGEIIASIEKNGLEILDSKQFVLENNSKFSIFVVKKL